jgi:hypothetical protein
MKMTDCIARTVRFGALLHSAILFNTSYGGYAFQGLCQNDDKSAVRISSLLSTGSHLDMNGAGDQYVWVGNRRFGRSARAFVRKLFINNKNRKDASPLYTLVTLHMTYSLQLER